MDGGEPYHDMGTRERIVCSERDFHFICLCVTDFVMAVLLCAVLSRQRGMVCVVVCRFWNLVCTGLVQPMGPASFP